MARPATTPRPGALSDEGEGHARSKTPISPLAGPYGHPVHPILVTVPIGAWIASLVFDIASRASDDAAAFAKGAHWLIAIGIIGAAAAAIFGLADLTRIKRGTRAWAVAMSHATLNVIVLVIFAVSWALRQADDGYRETSIGRLVLSIVALVLLAAAGSLGGTLSYRYGVRVADEATQAVGFGTSGRAPTGGSRDGGARAGL